MESLDSETKHRTNLFLLLWKQEKGNNWCIFTLLDSLFSQIFGSWPKFVSSLQGSQIMVDKSKMQRHFGGKNLIGAIKVSGVIAM